VPRCALCTLPNQHGLCRGCTRLLATYPRVAVSSVEFVALSRVDEFPEQFIWDWKDYSAAGGERWGPLPGWYSGWDGISLTMAASLSAYLESHASRLLADDPVITYAPTRAPLIAALLESAREQAWYAPEFVPTGAKAHGFVQHTSTAEERLERRAEDWLVDPDTPVSGRPVLLLDDVFVSGATTFSYAHALRLAGAREVRVVALIRHLRAGHVDYGDALRITRRTRDWSWDPTNCSVAEPARIKKPRRDH